MPFLESANLAGVRRKRCVGVSPNSRGSPVLTLRQCRKSGSARLKKL